jgi:hypothetical protein
MYEKEPVLEEDYHNIGAICSINYSEKDKINKVIGSIIEDVNYMLSNIDGNHDPNVCMDIFRNYKRLIDEVFKIFRGKIDGKLISEYSPNANGRIEILNEGHIIEEKVEGYKKYEEDYATEEYDNILEEYDDMMSRGMCSVIVH